MKNILELYQDHRSMHAAEFKRLLLNVKDSLLNATAIENFPHDYVQKIFETEENICRSVVCFESYINGEDLVSVSFGCPEDDDEIGVFPFDNRAVEELSTFLERFYVGIFDQHRYYINLRNKTIEFYFSFKNKFDEELFEDYGRLLGPISEEYKRVTRENLNLFNEDISDAIGKEITIGDWDLLYFDFVRNEKTIKTSEFEKGSLWFELSF